MTELNFPITRFTHTGDMDLKRGMIILPKFDFRLVAVTLPKELLNYKSSPTHVELYLGNDLITSTPIYGDIVFFDDKPLLNSSGYYSIVCSGGVRFAAIDGPKLPENSLFKVLGGANGPGILKGWLANIGSITIDIDMTEERLEELGIFIPEEKKISTDYVQAGYFNREFVKFPQTCNYNGINVWGQWDSDNRMHTYISQGIYAGPFMTILNGVQLGQKLRLNEIPALMCNFGMTKFLNNTFFPKNEISVFGQMSFDPNIAIEAQPGARPGNVILELQSNLLAMKRIAFNVGAIRTTHGYLNFDKDSEESSTVNLNFTTGTNIVDGLELHNNDNVEIINLGNYKFEVIVNGQSKIFDFLETMQSSVYIKIFPFFVTPVKGIGGDIYSPTTLSWIKIRNLEYEVLEIVIPETNIPSYYPGFASMCKKGDLNYVAFSEDLRNTILNCGDTIKFYMGTTFTLRSFGWEESEFITPDNDYGGILELHNVDFWKVNEVTFNCSCYGLETEIIERDLLRQAEINKKFTVGFTDGERIKLANIDIVGNKIINIKKAEGGLMINEAFFDTSYFSQEMPLRIFFQGHLDQFDVSPMIAYSTPPQMNYADITLEIKDVNIQLEPGEVPIKPPVLPPISPPISPIGKLGTAIGVGLVGVGAYLLLKKKKKQ